MAGTNDELEAELQRLCAAGRYDIATTRLIEGYGPQILGFLASRAAHTAEADEVFSTFCEDAWRGMEGFRWRCSALAWAYTIARNADLRHRRMRVRHDGRNVPLSQVAEIAGAASRVRTTTLPHLRSEVKSRMRQLREQLPEEAQTLLVLRVDRGLGWREIAHVMADPEAPDEPTDRVAARLRKRFQLAKAKLRDIAEREGVLDSH